jgi:exodeoxyribonuclease VII large subunit
MELFEQESPGVLSVSELTGRIKETLETRIGTVHVEGEISNFKQQTSGHLYFTLKDAGAQLSSVMFRGGAARLGFVPKDGLQVVAKGDISVYAPRGNYQLIVRSMRPKGKGTLQEQFEALKRKLQAEGLFEPERKKPLPAFPRRIGIITSPTGAAVRDFLQILRRRCPRIEVVVFGVNVQGAQAAGEIVRAVEILNERADCDLLVLARGGGSLEDLWSFNEETVARAVASSAIPTLSAIGHETDFTICDFVADLRAPTPSAAAELASRADQEWAQELAGFVETLSGLARSLIKEREWRWKECAGSYVFREPRRVIELGAQKLDDRAESLDKALRAAFDAKKQQFQAVENRWRVQHPGRFLEDLTRRLEERRARLRLLSPQHVLERGYAIVFDGGTVLKSVHEISRKKKVTVQVADGKIGLNPATPEE